METIHDFIKNEVPKYLNGRVLDIGGGEGRWKRILSEYATEYFISDLYSQAADFKDDARKLSNESSSFNAIVCFEVLEHIDDTERVVSEMYRVLKPGGYVAATLPFIFPSHGNPDDYKRLTPSGLEYYFKKMGFQVVQSGKIGNVLTILGVYCKYKVKDYAKKGKNRHLGKYFFLILQQIFRKLSSRFRYIGPDYFTHSFIIAKK
ncbi:MAG: class I SAM-dependent methyltransferase [Candidatus Zambryskibacteria bacterium]|nr:class I SAM-dependent methyltransferase [Candidatus Zambryskibacteria bacterium]